MNTELIEILRSIDKSLQKIANGNMAFAVPNIPLPPPEKTVTVYEWLDTWYTEYKVPELTKNGTKPIKECSGLRSIEICIRLHIKGNIRDKPLDKLTAFDIQTTVNKITSSRMKKYTYETFCAAVHQAYCNELVKDDVSTKTQKISHERENGTALTRQEEQDFIKLISGHKLEKLFLFYLASGVRKSEIKRIKWTHFDFDKNRLFIDGTKTKTSKRWVPIFDDIYKIIKDLSRKSEYVFTTPIYTIDNTFIYWQDKYKLEFTIKSLRHTFSTRHYENGVPIKVIQQWMGHAKTSTTENIYTHVQTSFEDEAFALANSKRQLIP